MNDESQKQICTMELKHTCIFPATTQKSFRHTTCIAGSRNPPNLGRFLTLQKRCLQQQYKHLILQLSDLYGRSLIVLADT